MYFSDIYKIRRKINGFLRTMKRKKTDVVIKELYKRLDDLINYKKEIIGFKKDGILEGNYEFQTILSYCYDFYKNLGRYKKEIRKAEELIVINHCLEVRDVLSCKDCSRFKTSICRIIINNELSTNKLIEYWNTVK